jgi:hypothetical protein
MNVRCLDGMITMRCQPKQNQGDSPIQISARKKSIKDQRG